jgi:hypothetical protein
MPPIGNGCSTVRSPYSWPETLAETRLETEARSHLPAHGCKLRIITCACQDSRAVLRRGYFQVKFRLLRDEHVLNAAVARTIKLLNLVGFVPLSILSSILTSACPGGTVTSSTLKVAAACEGTTTWTLNAPPKS